MRIHKVLRFSFLAAIAAHVAIAIGLFVVSSRLEEPTLSSVMALVFSTSLALLALSLVGGLVGNLQYRREFEAEKRQPLDRNLYFLAILLPILPIVIPLLLIVIWVIAILVTPGEWR